MILSDLLTCQKGLVPFFVAIYECCYIQSRYCVTAQNTSFTGSKVTTQGKPRYVLAAGLLTIAGILTSLATDDVRSTYICPRLAGKIVPFLQVLGAVLDSVVLMSTENAIRKTKASNPTAGTAAPKVVGSVLVVSQLVLGELLILTS